MRENRTYGSEGGEGLHPFPTPIAPRAQVSAARNWVSVFHGCDGASGAIAAWLRDAVIYQPGACPGGVSYRSRRTELWALLGCFQAGSSILCITFLRLGVSPRFVA